MNTIMYHHDAIGYGKNVTFTELMMTRDEHVVRVLLGRAASISRRHVSPGADCCPDRACRTCNSVAQVINLLAYDDEEFKSYCMYRVTGSEDPAEMQSVYSSRGVRLSPASKPAIRLTNWKQMTGRDIETYVSGDPA